MMTQRPGFTMIELLIVVVIVSILAALAIPTLTRARERGFYTALRADLKHLQNQQEIYYHTAGLAYKTNGTLDWTGVDADLNFMTSEGVTIELGDHTGGWAATATHSALADEQCNVYMGASGATIGEATVPGVISCSATP